MLKPRPSVRINHVVRATPDEVYEQHVDEDTVQGRKTHAVIVGACGGFMFLFYVFVLPRRFCDAITLLTHPQSFC